MRAAVERGLTTEARCPGGGRRTAPSWKRRVARHARRSPAQLCAVYATAIGRGKRAWRPRRGGAVERLRGPGRRAAAALARQRARCSHDERAIDFLLAGAAVGGLLRARGVRQVGCQGEVGVAAAMAAAGYAAVLGGSNAQILFAAERALEPHLGLACDPAGGRIEDPCIERNALAATRAYNAAVAAVRMPVPRVGLDMLARSMVESGRVMAGRYKATSIGGVAVNIAEC